MRFDDCDGFLYVVQENDTLYGISRRFEIPLAWLINANEDDDIYNLYVGKRICIPNRDPMVDIIPIVPIRPWPGNFGGPGPVVPPYKPMPPFDNYGPYNDPRDPRYGDNNPFGQIGEEEDGEEHETVVYDDMYDDGDMETTDNGDGQTGQRTGGSQPVPYVIITYVVKQDDNLQNVLERFGISLDQVLRHNDTVQIYLKPGTVLRVPNTNAMDEQKFESR